MKEYYLIARVISVYGKEGYVKVQSYSDFPERFSGLKKVYIDFFGDKKTFNVERTLEVKGNILLKFFNFDSSEDAGILAGKDIYVDEQDVVGLPDNTYFIHDLVGSEVIEEGKNLGRIKDVLSFPANDVYVIETAGGKELLIPALKNIIEKFDPVKKIMILKPGTSLYDED